MLGFTCHLAKVYSTATTRILIMLNCMIELRLQKGYYTLETLHLWFPSEVNPIDSSIISSNLESVFQISKFYALTGSAVYSQP